MSSTTGEMNGTTMLTRRVLDYGIVLELGFWIQQGHRMTTGYRGTQHCYTVGDDRGGDRWGHSMDGGGHTGHTRVLSRLHTSTRDRTQHGLLATTRQVVLIGEAGRTRVPYSVVWIGWRTHTHCSTVLPPLFLLLLVYGCMDVWMYGDSMGSREETGHSIGVGTHYVGSML